MSFKAVFEFFLQVHEFANVDLPSQGIFRLRASLYQQQSKQKIYATPFELMKASSKPVANPKKIFAQQSIELPYFYTKAGVIKYSDERLTFNDLIRFKLEIQSFPRLHSEQVYLEFELLFSEFGYSSNLEFSLVDTKKFRLENIQHGIMNYCQGQFNGTYSCKFVFTLFACLTNFKFGKYKLPSEIEALQRQDEEGQIKVENAKSNQTVRVKQMERSNIKSFDQLLAWVGKYYKKVENPLSYFYNTYTKNLRYYFYQAQQKLNKNSIVKNDKILKVPKEFLQFNSSAQRKNDNQTEVSVSQFRKYMTSYQPKNLTGKSILEEINTIYSDIYLFLMTVQDEFQLNQLMSLKMKNEYQLYVKERYGERVFRSVIRGNDISLSSSSRQNRKIAKKMREKQGMTTVSYPIEDMSFIQSRNTMQYLFYEITNPKPNKTSQNQNGQEKVMKVTDKTLDNIFGKIEKEEKQEFKSTIFEDTLEQKQGIIINSSDQMKQDKEDKEDKVIEEQKEYSFTQKTKKDNNDDEDEDEDVYANVLHEKGSVDSEITQKSMEKQQNNCFQGISDIECKIKAKQKKEFESQILPDLQYDEKNMLVVMCHGFQGSSYDMTILLRGLKQLLPNASYLLARCNEGLTEGDIEEMGNRLHEQVEGYIKNYMEEETVILNFVGHSMGGIVARAGVKHLMKKYYNQFGFFCSLSSPHLGYLNGVDGMIKAGLWAILKFKPIKSLQQLKMEDQKDLKQTFLFKLSTEGSLKRFRKIILFSSFEDSYVSWHSARISAHGKSTKLTKLQQEMASNILGDQPIHRIDVNFNVQTKNLDSFIGRTAHINLIIQQSLFKIVNSTLPELFDITKS